MKLKNVAKNTIIVITLLAAITLICIIQFGSPHLYGCDEYFHVRMAHIIRSQGFPTELHWARYTTMNKNYSDRDFLMHVFIIPFTYLSQDFFFGAKVAVCVFGAIIILTLAWVGSLFCKKGWIPFLVLGLLFSSNFLYGLAMFRPYLVSVIFGLWGIYALVKRNFLGIFASSFLYSLFHMSSPLLFIWAVFNEIIRKVNKEKASIKPIVVVLVGLVLALFFYPNFYSNFYNVYVNAYSATVHVLTSFSQYKGIRFPAGGEMNPLSTRALIFDYPLMGLSIILAIISLIFRKPTFSIRTQLLSSVAILFMIFTLLGSRFAIQSYPYITLFTFAFLSEIGGHFSWGKKFMRRKYLFLIFIPIIGILVPLGLNISNNVKEFIKDNKENMIYVDIAKWMKENLGPGELIYNEVWSDATFLMGLNPDNDYLDFLASEYMYKYDPRLYELRVQTNMGMNVLYNIKYIFKAKNGICYRFSPLGQTVLNEPGFIVLALIGPYVIFEVP
jgi:hypothetical protein